MLERTSLGPISRVASNVDYAAQLDALYSEKTPTERKSSLVQNVTVVHGTANPEHDVPRAAMSLKEATALYAMYLTFEDRDRLFGELDFLLDPDGWDEYDALPNRAAFVNFLKWAVETRRHDWTSLGLDGDGNTSVAFKRGSNILSALFLPNAVVQWTSKRSTEDGPDVAAGQAPLRIFAQRSMDLLETL